MATMNQNWLDSPQNSNTPSEGDDEIRETRTEFYDRLVKEHDMGGTTTADGQHKKGSAVVYYAATAPTNRPDAETALDTDDDGRPWIDTDDNYLRVWDGDSFEAVCAAACVAATAPTGVSGADDTGLLHIDSDNSLLYYWDGDSWEAANSPVPDQGGGNGLLCKIVEIGDWDMNLTASVNVAHSLGGDWKNIRSLSAVIRNDADSFYSDFTGWRYSSGEITNTSISANSTNIVMERATGGGFDNTNYDSTSYNRGWITMWYTA